MHVHKRVPCSSGSLEIISSATFSSGILPVSVSVAAAAAGAPTLLSGDVGVVRSSGTELRDEHATSVRMSTSSIEMSCVTVAADAEASTDMSWMTVSRDADASMDMS